MRAACAASAASAAGAALTRKSRLLDTRAGAQKADGVCMHMRDLLLVFPGIAGHPTSGIS